MLISWCRVKFKLFRVRFGAKGHRFRLFGFIRLLG